MMAETTHEGDEAALSDYIAEHEDDLVAERDAIRNQAVAPDDEDQDEYPLLKKDLLCWFEKHGKKSVNA